MNKEYRKFVIACIARTCYHLNLKEDFFLLTGDEISKLDELRQAVRHPYNKYSGKSPCRDFWDYLKTAKFPF